MLKMKKTVSMILAITIVLSMACAVPVQAAKSMSDGASSAVQAASPFAEINFVSHANKESIPYERG